MAGPVGVGTLSEIAELIGLVVVAEFQDGGTSDVANSGRRFDIECCVFPLSLSGQVAKPTFGSASGFLTPPFENS
jgi:hypothetical protein